MNTIHSGLAPTNLMREANPVMRSVTHLFSPPAERAAEGIVRVANAQKQLWQVSAELTKLDVA